MLTHEVAHHFNGDTTSLKEQPNEQGKNYNYKHEYEAEKTTVNSLSSRGKDEALKLFISGRYNQFKEGYTDNPYVRGTLDGALECRTIYPNNKILQEFKSQLDDYKSIKNLC